MSKLLLRWDTPKTRLKDTVEKKFKKYFKIIGKRANYCPYIYVRVRNLLEKRITYEINIKKVHYNGKFEDGSRSIMTYEVESAIIDYSIGNIEWVDKFDAQQVELISYDKDIDYYTAVYEISLDGEVVYQNGEYLKGLTNDEKAFAQADRMKKLCTNWNKLFELGIVD